MSVASKSQSVRCWYAEVDGHVYGHFGTASGVPIISTRCVSTGVLADDIAVLRGELARVIREMADGIEGVPGAVTA